MNSSRDKSYAQTQQRTHAALCVSLHLFYNDEYMVFFELTLPHSAARSVSFGRPHDAHQRAERACSSRRIATDSMQLHHAAYAASCRHTPMTHAYTGISCSIAARPGHGLNSLTLTTATRAAGPRPNVIRPVDARATGLFLTD
jgi:hypothetical protein